MLGRPNQRRKLLRNYPNPFITETWIPYELKEAASQIYFEVFSNLKDSKKVRTIKLGPQEAGYHKISWDGRNDDGKEVVSGRYMYGIKAVIPSEQPFPIELLYGIGVMFLIR